MITEAELRLWLICKAQAVQLRLLTLDPVTDHFEVSILKAKALQIAEGLEKAGATAAGRI